MPDISPSSNPKRALRREVRSILRAVPHDEIEHRSRLLVAHLTKSGDWCGQGDVVALFGGLPEEPDLLPLLPWLHERGARAVFFAVQNRDLTAVEVRTPADLRRGTLGVWEPVADPARVVSHAELTTILTPALAFGQSDGSRLGRGAGFYDRLFARPEVRARRVGIAFDLQIVTAVPIETHDERVDVIVTESGWIRF